MAILIWFQRDLRIKDNPMLDWALKQNQAIIAIFIDSPEEDTPWKIGAASSWWLHQSLNSLAKKLESLNISLHFFRGNSVEIIPKLIRTLDITSIAWTIRYEPNRTQCEKKIIKLLKQQNISINTFKPFFLTNPERFLTKKNNRPYRVFTPFYKRLRTRILDTTEKKYGEPGQLNHRQLYLQKKPFINISSIKLKQLNLLDSIPWHQKLHNHWQPGEDSAEQQINKFIQTRLEDYKNSRDLPAMDITSKLSPHLHFGEISIRKIISMLQNHMIFNTNQVTESVECFLRQLIWKEFANYLLFHFPNSTQHSMDASFNNSFWQQNQEALRKWQSGNTGFDIIDAAMHQLWQCGWIHNRTRMLCASFLTKNLGIHWIEGAHWFWNTLVDADLANNTMGWQWVAGCGVDAAPYFRIFNPITQQARFDSEKKYITRWNGNQNIEPIVDLKQSRENALLRYRKIKTIKPSK